MSNLSKIQELEQERLNLNTRIMEGKKILELYKVREYQDPFSTGRVLEGIRSAAIRLAEIEQEIKVLRTVRL